MSSPEAFEDLDAVLAKSQLRSGAAFKPGTKMPATDAPRIKSHKIKKKSVEVLKNWYGMKKQQVTPELQQDLFLIQNRRLFSTKNGENKWARVTRRAMPKFFEVGHVVDSAVDFHSRKQRRGQRVADAFLHDTASQAILSRQRPTAADGGRGKDGPKKRPKKKGGRKKTKWGSKF
eukprot:EG_transcript_28902